MGIIMFLVDTSASMNQRTYLGTSYLDVAKGAIDTFMKYRSRDPASRGDRYMLVSFDEPPNAVKSGWKENHATFVYELKNLQATGLSSFGQALKEGFSLLNLHRLHSSIDHYGQGRNPFFLEPAVIIALTDSAKLTNQITVEDELTLPLDSQAEGSELTKEPFRWDQRLFTVLLRLPGMGGVNNSTNSVEISLSNMCEATGGKCYLATNQKLLVQAMESLSQKMHPGVVINFQKIGGALPSNNSIGPGSKEISRSNTPVAMETDSVHQRQLRGTSRDSDKVSPGPGDGDAAAGWFATKKMIYVKPSTKNNVPTGFWPIPESFWPDSSLTTLPPRHVHPVVWFSTVDTPPLLVENFPFDKYELEPSPLTQYILAKKNPHICWQVYIEDSGKEPGIIHPFGYLKSSSSLAHINLFVMPFNFTTLLPLISELQRHAMRPPQKWRQEFSDYISSLPSYYSQPLRNSLRLMGAPMSLVPDVFELQLSFSITNYLHKLKKQAKMESERVVSAITQNRTNDTNKRTNGIVDLGEGISIAIGSTNKGLTTQSFRNPFDIVRSSLLEHVCRMRANFLHTCTSSTSVPNLIEEVSRHQIPISQMGNYQEHLKRLNPLREVDSGAVRTQLFGNPFKLEKRGSGSDSEISFADEHMVESLGSRKSPGRKPRLRPPSPRFPSKSPLPLSSLPSSPLPSPTPPPSHPPVSTNHTPGSSGRSRAPKERSPDEEVMQTNEQKYIPAGKEVKNGGKVESSKEGVSNQANDFTETEQSRKVKMASNSAKTTPTNTAKSAQPGGLSGSANELKNTTKNNFDKLHRLQRKRERTPSPTPSVPGAKRRANSPSAQTTAAVPVANSTANSDGQPQPLLSNPRIGHPALKPLGGANNSTTKLPGVVRLVKPEISSASKVLNEEIQKQQGQENARLKTLIFKEVRKPGKNYDALFQHLEGVKGSVEVRRIFVQDVIREATKFKKKPLILQLEEWTEKLPSFRTGPGGKPKVKAEKR